MIKLKKRIFTVCLIALVAAVSVGSTYSWLSMKSNTVVNTFAGGTISLSVDETEVDAYGNPTGDGSNRTQTGNSYKFVAGSVMTKDPTVTVLAGSEECYVYMCVQNELSSDLFEIDYSDEWTLVKSSDDETIKVYRYNNTVDASNSDVKLPSLFTTITVSDELTPTDVENIGTAKLDITSYAVQTEAITQNEADKLAAAQFIS